MQYAFVLCDLGLPVPKHWEYSKTGYRDWVVQQNALNAGSRRLKAPGRNLCLKVLERFFTHTTGIQDCF